MSEDIPQSVEVVEPAVEKPLGPARFRTRSVEVTALQWVGEPNCREAFEFVGLDHDDWVDETDHSELHVPRLLDTPTAHWGDWLVKDEHGVSVMRDAEFRARYEEAPEPSDTTLVGGA